MMQQMRINDLKSAISQLDRRAPPNGVQAAGEAERLELWLALPEGATYFDAERLSATQTQKLAGLRTSARRQDFFVSRALQQHVAPRANESLTHSAGYAALACAPASRIGVDLERHRSRNAAALARFAFSQEEHAALMSLAEGSRTARFYTLWVMKEAFAKALQLPLLEALRHCTFTEARGHWRGSVPTAAQWRVQVFEPREGFSLAVAVVGDDLPKTLHAYEWPPTRRADWKHIASVESSKAF